MRVWASGLVRIVAGVLGFRTWALGLQELCTQNRVAPLGGFGFKGQGFGFRSLLGGLGFTLAPKVCKIMAFMVVIMALGLFCYILLGFRV